MKKFLLIIIPLLLTGVMTIHANEIQKKSRTNTTIELQKTNSNFLSFGTVTNYAREAVPESSKRRGKNLLFSGIGSTIGFLFLTIPFAVLMGWGAKTYADPTVSPTTRDLGGTCMVVGAVFFTIGVLGLFAGIASIISGILYLTGVIDRNRQKKEEETVSFFLGNSKGNFNEVETGLAIRF